MNKKVKWGLTAAIGVGLIGWGIYSQMPKENKELAAADKMAAQESRNNRVLNVNAKIIQTETLVDKQPIIGTLIPDEEVNLSFEASGKIVEINFNEGTPVKKGQLLAKVNDLELQAELRRLEAQVKLAEDRVHRQLTLLERDAVSQEAYEQVRTDLATLNADIDIVKEKIKLTELRAPFDGVIGLREVSVGAYATPTTIIAKLTKTIPLKIEFDVTERDAHKVKRGTNLTFTMSGNDITQYTARVYAVESALDPELHKLTVRALYPNHNQQLMPGYFVNIELKKEEIQDAIAIPTEAIVPEMGKDKVYLYKSGTAQPVDVITGLRTESKIQVIRGLEVGDTIITSGTMQLRTGLKVTLDNIEQ